MNTKTKEHIQDLEEKLWISEFRFNRHWIEQILTEDFFEFGRSGRIHSRLDCINTPEQELKVELPLRNFHSEFLASNVILTTYISKVRENNDIVSSNRSSIWLHTDNGWQLKFHQGTPTKTEFSNASIN